ncbi:MAG: hypothetical protein U0905_20100 [Pirellulales bacterium]
MSSSWNRVRSSARNQFRRRLHAECLELRQLMASDLGCMIEDHEPHGLLDLSHLRGTSQAHWEQSELIEESEHAHDDHAEGTVGSDVGMTRSLHSYMLDSSQGLRAPGSLVFAASSPFEVPAFNSLPGASKTLYLDFDGHFESSWGSYTNVTSPAFDRDGSPTSLSVEELQYIQDVWEIVAEDYAPFNINVTTVEPSVLAAGVPNDQANGIALRIAIGGTETVLSANAGSGLAGMALINSFTSTSPNVAFVFPASSTGSLRDSSTIGITVSHEAGHSFGLLHQQNSYDLLNEWQGIMNSGVFGFDDAVWVTGRTSATATQDDMAMLSAALGNRADDVGNTISSAASMSGTGVVWNGQGIISSTSDIDVWSILPSQNDSLEISLSGATLGQNLDAVLELLDESGNVLASSNPASTNDAKIYAQVTANVPLFLRVRSTGEYGRVGQYWLSTQSSVVNVQLEAKSLLTTSESGLSDSATFSLTRQPTSDVSIVFTSTSPQEGTLSSSTLVFTPTNWYLPQTLSIVGANDSLLDGPIQYRISASVQSADLSYEGMAIPDLNIINNDNELNGWSKQVESLTRGSTIATYDMIVQADGSTIVVGTFSGTVDFDPSSAVASRTAAYISNLFLAKYSASGDLAWVQTFDNTTGLISPNSFVSDSSGNLYVAATFSGTNVVLGSTTLSSSGGSSDAALLKFSSSGALTWAINWGSSGVDSANDLAIDSSGNILVLGYFSATVDFNPGKGTTSRTSAGGYDGFLAKFTSSGTFSSVTTYGGVNNDNLLSMQIDSSNQVYVLGNFSTSTTIGSQSMVSLGAADTFMAKLNATGTVQWVRQGASQDSSTTLHRISLAPNGRIAWTGEMKGSITLGSNTIVGENTYGLYMSEWDSNGNLLQSGQMSSPSRIIIGETAFDPQGRLIVFGSLTGTTDLAPGVATNFATPPSPSAHFVARLQANSLIDAYLLPSTSTLGSGRELGIDSRGNLFVSGYLADRVLTPSGGIPKNTQGGPDFYLSKMILNPDPVDLFFDSFESGEWNGVWVEDVQDDWYWSTQRATHGTRSAEVDGPATNATLSLASPVNLTGYASASLTFDWLIESGFDTGEYLSLDLSTNNGATWIQDVRRLNGNVSAENTWIRETVDLTPYQTSQFKIRFRSSVSDSTEDANVDNVRITGTLPATGLQTIFQGSGPSAPSIASSSQLSSPMAPTPGTIQGNSQTRPVGVSLSTDSTSSSPMIDWSMIDGEFLEEIRSRTGGRRSALLRV